MAVIAEATDHVAGLAVETRRLRRPEPVDRARRPVRDGGRLRARLRHAPRWRAAASRSSGLGRVGGKLARLLAEAGAALVVADVDDGKRALADELGARWTDPDAALTADVDVLAPCALGGVLDDDTRARAAAAA